MNNELINFHHEMFGDIRAIEKDGEPWFVGKDVAKALGYNNTRDTLYKHVDEEDKRDGVAFRDTIGREQKMTIINESGLYSLVLSSKPPSAKQFKRWVTTRQSAAMQHTSNVGVGFIPTLAAAGHLLCILSASGRAGINPAPTVDTC